jgi:hypothetical protein
MEQSVQERSERLSARVEALASALRASGADPDAVSRLLGGAASAALQALTLDLLHEPAEPLAAGPAVVADLPLERRVERDVPLAA